MPAHVDKCPQLACVISHRNHGRAGDFGRHELPWIGDLFRSANHLPGRVEHGPPFEVENFRVGVPVGGNRPGCGQRQIWIERREFFCQSGCHARQCSRMSGTAKHFGRQACDRE